MRIFVQIGCNTCVCHSVLSDLSLALPILVYRCYLFVFCKLKMSEISSWEDIENDRKLKSVQGIEIYLYMKN